MEGMMTFWYELMVSVGVAVAVYGGYEGLGVFLQRMHEHGNPSLEYELSANRSMSDEDAPSAESDALDFLREAVRLAEERLKAQGEQARALERKVVLLGAFCVVTVAFLLTGEFDSVGAFPVKVTAIILLVMAAAFCARAIDFYHYGAVGFYTPELNVYAQDPRLGDQAYLLRCALAEYSVRIPLNEQSTNEKASRLERANQFWVIGISATLGTFAGNGALVEYLRNLLIG